MSTTRVGVTGTQAGTTPDQRAAIVALLVSIQPAELHHGDCTGADADLHGIAREHVPAARIVIHPPDNPVKRAFCRGGEERRQLPYLVRDQAIVNGTDRLIAAPGGPERVRSGTWYTVRYAAGQGRHISIVWPDGSVEERPAPGGPS
ncbi:MAG: hypothetical protein WCI67_09000 [Chloroflexales bacterium]